MNSMHQLAYVLVLYACAFATNEHSRTKRYWSNPSADLQIPELHKNLKTSRSDFSSQHLYASRIPNDSPDTSSPFLLNPENWEPPKYVKLLKDFDEALEEIRSHLIHKSAASQTGEDSHFFILTHVLNGLAVHVAQNGWTSYDENYVKLVRSLVDNAKKDPQGAIDDINCMMNAASQNTLKIRQVIKHPWIDYLCKIKPAYCDTIIHAVVKFNPDVELNQEAEALPFLGQIGWNYLKLYSDFHHEASGYDVLTYLWTRKNSLRRLVYHISVVRRQIFPLEDKCSIQISPHVNMLRYQ